MDEITLKAYAKINLSLAITGKRDDGYHNLSTIMQTISLFDKVTIKKSYDNITCNTDNKNIPSGEGNIAFKAAKKFFEFVNIDGGAIISIKKNIPFGAGMGGGSADAAAVLKGLNELYSTKINLDDLIKIASKIGADVPFALFGGTALVQCIGDKISKLKPFMDCYILVVKPDLNISTAKAYSNYDKNFNSKVKNMDELVECINSHNLKSFCAKMFNDFEMVTNIPIINKIKNEMLLFGALGSCLTGSGSTVFGIYDDESKANKANKKFKKYNLKSFLCTLIKNYKTV